jgi:CBS domain-containing protein
MKVEQLMTRDVSSCTSDATLNEAARIMWERDCGVVPVVGDGAGHRVVGIVTDRDACMAAYTKGLPLSQIRIGDVMTTHVVSCEAGEDVRSAEQTMRSAQVHRLPVVDDAGQLVGMISLSDIACAAARGSRSRSQAVSPAAVGETVVAIHKRREAEAVHS